MAPRSQPHRITWPFNPDTANNVDEMFQILFDDVRNDAIFPVTTEGDLMYRDATHVTRLGIGAANTVLRTDGVDPEWGKADLTLDVTGTLPVASGGTGAVTLTGILEGNGTSPVTAIALPADATQFLNGTGAFSTPVSGVNMAVVMTRIILGI